MSQAPLFLAIHLVGLALNFSTGLGRRPALACALGFPIGLAATVMAAMLLLVVGIPYEPWTLAAAVLIPTAVIAARRAPARLDRPALRLAALWTVGFGLVALALAHWNLSLMNWDSHRTVLLGGVLGRDGALEPRMLSELHSWGVFQIVAQSLAELTRRDYLYGLQPVFGASFVSAFAVALWYATGRLGARGGRRVAAVAVVSTAMASLYFFVHHAFFIHSNLGTAVYLFGFVVLYWLAEIDGDPSILPIAFLCILAVAIHRIETPLVALIALAVTIPTTELPRRSITPLLAGFTVAVSGWYVLLAFHVSPDSLFLTPARAIQIVLAIVAFLGWWLISRAPLLQRVSRRVPLLVSAALVLALAAAFATRPRHMTTSLDHWVTNLTTLPHWGYAWYGIVAAALLAVFTPPPPRHRVFTLTIWLTLAYTLLIVYARVPYRVAILDSANRMTIHVLPLVFFYLGLKAVPAAAVSPPRADV
jgi:hypothetical protein